MIKVITDSPSDIPLAEQEKYGITTLSVPITIDGVTYREGVDMTSEDYYTMLVNAQAVPTHAQITTLEWKEAFKEALAQGATGIVCVTITSKGSGIYDAACLARRQLVEDHPEDYSGITIDVVDSRSYTYVYGCAVVAGAKAAAQGGDREAVLAAVHAQLDSYTAFVGLTNLTYAKKSGRITTVAAFVGEVMGFRPILTLEDGALVTKSKVRGDHKLIETMGETYRQQVAEDGRPYYIICADSMENGKLLHKEIARHTKNPFGGYYRIGPSVTTNSGPTIFGFFAPRQR